jgi:hypothetical protein
LPYLLGALSLHHGDLLFGDPCRHRDFLPVSRCKDGSADNRNSFLALGLLP